MKRSLSLLLLLALLCAPTVGCFRMTIVNGDEVAHTPAVQDKWRSSAVLDIFPIDAPLGLDTVCKDSRWAKITQEHSALDYLVDVFLAGWVYESTHVDIYCTKPGAAAPVPASTGPAALPPSAPPSPTGTPTAPPTGTPTSPPPTQL